MRRDPSVSSGPVQTPRPRTLAAALLAVVLLLTACGGADEDTAGSPETTAADTSASVTPAAAETGRYEIATANVTGAVDIYPEAGATEPNETISNPTEYDLPRVFLVAENQGDWLKVWLPKRPNGTQGWVKASDVTLDSTDYKLVVDVPGYTITLYDGDEVVEQFPVGTAQETYPTPPGTYFITDLLQPPDPDTVYGTYAYGLSGYSEVLTSFNGGDGQLGVHGTNKPESIGKQDSHGCVRLHNEDIEVLVPLLKLGTPVEIRT